MEAARKTETNTLLRKQLFCEWTIRMCKSFFCFKNHFSSKLFSVILNKNIVIDISGYAKNSILLGMLQKNCKIEVWELYWNVIHTVNKRDFIKKLWSRIYIHATVEHYLNLKFFRNLNVSIDSTWFSWAFRS